MQRLNGRANDFHGLAVWWIFTSPLNINKKIGDKTMKTLKFKFDLDCKVSIYVPSTVNVDEKTDNSEQVKRTITELAQMFGGATASKAVGGWVCANGETVLEEVTIVYSFCSSAQLQENFAKVYAIAERIKNEMKQEAVTLEVNGQVKFV